MALLKNSLSLQTPERDGGGSLTQPESSDVLRSACWTNCMIAYECMQNLVQNIDFPSISPKREPPTDGRADHLIELRGHNPK